ncbi:MFS transporter [Lysinibacillus sp. NPDC098008]|uniref:MFS transporter n=1 Tax=Lysinibacillus sp. NPDC098008 TaxID=3364146 RepID=UPI0038064C37
MPSRITVKDHIIFHAAVFCFWFSMYIYSPIFGVYLEFLGFSYSSIGLILGSYGVTQILCRFPLGILSDVLHKIKKYLWIVGFVCIFISCLMFVYLESFWAVLMARLLAGITASMWVMATVLYSYYFHPSQSTRAMGAIQFNTVFTQFICVTIGGYLVHVFDWKFPFWIGAIVAILGIVLTWNIKVVKIENTTAMSMQIKDYVKKTYIIKGLKMITYLSMIAHAILFITIFGFSPIMATSIGVTEQQIIWLMCAFFIPHVASSFSLVIINMSSAYTRKLLIVSFGATSIFLALIPYATSLQALCFYHSGLGLALGFIFPLLLSEVTQYSPPQLKMSAMGFYQSFYALGIFIGPIVTGIIAEYRGLGEVFYLSAIVTAFSTILYLIMSKNRS